MKTPEDKQASAEAIQKWTVWRRAKDNEATSLRKELGLCIAPSCKHIPAPGKTRCYYHGTINAKAGERFVESIKRKCSQCGKMRNGTFDDNGRCYYCQRDNYQASIYKAHCKNCKHTRPISLVTNECLNCGLKREPPPSQQ